MSSLPGTLVRFRTDLEHAIGREHTARRRRRRRLAVLATVAFVAVAAGSAFAMRAVFLDKGFVGLPPIGATPSSPESGELVLAAYGLAEVGRTKVWVYSDGRLISQREFMGGEPTSGSANRWSSGFLEQHLSPEGVEVLRSEIVSTGLFADDRELRFDGQPCLNWVRVRDGDGLVGITWHGSQCPVSADIPGATAEEARTLGRLVERLADPVSWLPVSAWETSAVRAYVPSNFAVCYGTSPPTHTPDPMRVLDVLPTAAVEMLRDKARTPVEGLYSPGPGDIRPVTDYCSDLSTNEAQALAATLDEGEYAERGGAFRLHYRFEARRPDQDNVSIYFEPYLPHGEIICSACG